MFDSDPAVAAVRLGVALGVGLLVGTDRERRMVARGRRGAAGIRTFALVGLLGGVAQQLGGMPLLAVGLAFVAAAGLVGYFRESSDLGLTTEVAMVVTFLIGALAQSEPALASGVGVTVTILLATRSWLHHFVSSVLTEEETHDGLLLGACALVALPLLPDRTIDPFDSVNPFAVWRLVVLLMAISGAGYIAVRAVGPRYGLPVAGFLGGFVSSTATIGAMGARARTGEAFLRPAVAAALLSTVATIVQLAAILAVTSPETLRELSVPLGLAGAGAFAIAAATVVRARAVSDEDSAWRGHAFHLPTAILLALVVTLVSLLSAIASDLGGDRAVQVAAFLGGLADAHAAAIGVATVAASGKLTFSAAAVGVLAALSANTLSKIVFAYFGGGVRFTLPVGAGLLLVLGLAWSGTLVSLSP